MSRKKYTWRIVEMDINGLPGCCGALVFNGLQISQNGFHLANQDRKFLSKEDMWKYIDSFIAFNATVRKYNFDKGEYVEQPGTRRVFATDIKDGPIYQLCNYLGWWALDTFVNVNSGNTVYTFYQDYTYEG